MGTTTPSIVIEVNHAEIAKGGGGRGGKESQKIGPTVQFSLGKNIVVIFSLHFQFRFPEFEENRFSHRYKQKIFSKGLQIYGFLHFQ